MQKKPGIARRAVVGVGKVWAYSTGITSLARELGRIGGNLGGAAGAIRRKLSDGPQNYRNEKFQEAVDRLGLDEGDLVKLYKYCNTWGLGWLASLLLTTFWLAGAVWSNAPVLHVILCFGWMFVTFSKAITWRFRACQIRDAELYSFGPWFLSPGRW